MACNLIISEILNAGRYDKHYKKRTHVEVLCMLFRKSLSNTGTELSRKLSR